MRPNNSSWTNCRTIIKQCTKHTPPYGLTSKVAMNFSKFASWFFLVIFTEINLHEAVVYISPVHSYVLIITLLLTRAKQ